MLLLLLLLLFLLYSQLLSSPKSQGTTFHTQRSSETSRAITGVYPSPPVHTLGFIAIRGCSMPPAARPFSSSFANLRFRAFGDVKRPHAGQYKQKDYVLSIHRFSIAIDECLLRPTTLFIRHSLNSIIRTNYID